MRSGKPVEVGIVGGTGYTGVELLRLLALHPGVRIRAVTSRADAGKAVADLYPNLRGHVDVVFTDPEVENLGGCDVVFFATPNGIAMQSAPALLEQGIVVIDLSADFRLKDADEWAHWYGQEHACPGLLSEAVYGLPEVRREAIRSARLIANPGCYPTAVQLGLLPLLENRLVAADRLIADVKSGVSGAGRKAEVPLLMSETGESFKAYAVAGHRHWPEIVQGLVELAGEPVGLTFVPHLLPMIRGIHATLYAVPVDEPGDIQRLYEERYCDEPFVDVLPPGSHPDTRDVRGSNRCQIAVFELRRSGQIVVLSVIDNLVKGAAGQAVQNMNLRFGFAETTGLQAIGLYP
ncbi:N-acetyl-gamma-glutamyl-phosphate reductase [Methylococcus capsulatus]|uniref:N-acetyl-gamma-glutamyl-phosphate reductase n=1 Tax=Methylococcus capsulatus TaxID=414 RepID=UPI001C533FE5|nr:N-acetyl-gamma-glutamyl-phosphate reductase [Methylococcus capsulatus]QXP88502.1 N-acetyl-gamma-glutamyl-phosphate reductase [Methylococcus capsulatus]QXP94482.1 N-acetyl-gamma-glutamyl-phosphate reductase [Methylococcus capsulatus]UQN13551.1 N-acetyl-gamma-glutamyl-phosphate reductase [Methylococcus capsulatus]